MLNRIFEYIAGRPSIKMLIHSRYDNDYQKHKDLLSLFYPMEILHDCCLEIDYDFL